MGKQRVFSIVTEALDDEVYKKLESKKQNKLLAKYINELVIRDLKSHNPEQIVNQFSEQHKESLKEHAETQKLLRQLLSKMNNIRLDDGAILERYKDFNSDDYFKEGQLIVSEEITGSLDDEDLKDPDL